MADPKKFSRELTFDEKKNLSAAYAEVISKRTGSTSSPVWDLVKDRIKVLPSSKGAIGPKGVIGSASTSPSEGKDHRELQKRFIQAEQAAKAHSANVQATAQKAMAQSRAQNPAIQADAQGSATPQLALEAKIASQKANTIKPQNSKQG